MNENYDVVVVGGGAAGLSGAVALARSRRSVLVVDAGEPRNAPAGHVHNYLARESTPPAQLLAAGREEVIGYGGEIVAGAVTSTVALDRGGFAVELADGRTTRARRLLVATGLVDELPDVPGVAQRWGRDVLHCPYCHGWEARDQAIGVLATNPMAVHQALMWRQLSDDVVVFRHTSSFDAEQLDQLAARGIRVVDGEVSALRVEDDVLTGVFLSSGEVVAREAIVVAPRFTARADVLVSLGLKPVELEVDGHVIGSSVPADATGATTVPGVWVAGNVTDMKSQVVVSAAAGLTAGAAINGDLVAEDVRRAREPFAHEMERRVAAMVSGTTKHGVATMAEQHEEVPFDQESWDERYRSKPAIWSGRPNEQLVTEAADLRPGSALDAGCGEGGDAVWLAQNGWRVTAADFAATALDRGAAQATSLGLADRIRWLTTDLTTWVPDEKYDLVTSHFLHLPTAQRTPIFARLADAVAPGGTLLIVGHHPTDVHGAAHRPNVPDMFFLAEDVARTLDSSWESVVTEARDRTTVIEGHEVSIRDTVLVARKR
ncbi:FAD-dependent oxidoreductase [Amycolatopsis sp. NPDC004368]